MPRINIDLSDVQYRAFKILCMDQKTSMSRRVRELIERDLAESKSTNEAIEEEMVDPF